MARILVVDDTLSARELARSVLRTAGYPVDVAVDGVEAVEKFAANPPDLVLLDVMMPRMDGFETCTRIRQLDPLNEVPVVFLTALDDDAVHTKAQAVGADDFLVKPLRRSELLIRVRSLLRIRDLNKARRQQLETISSQKSALEQARMQRGLVTDLLVHDMKNLLQAILANTEMAMVVPDKLKYHRRVLDAVVALQAMQFNLLDVSRSEDGELPMNAHPTDLAEMARRVGGQLQGLASRRDITLQVQAPQPIERDADPQLLRRVLENLCHNAIAHCPAQGQITLRVLQDGDQTVLQVDDTGSGVPVALREHIFDLYGQADRAARGSGRHGLGLAFCRQAVAAHGGTITVLDAPGGGARFEIRL